ncbi:TadE-like protein [Aeromicrobium sp. A1-2]|uniref:Rv3654c family TadE-like protein n=1 Tax=Aeromicrobium sp. A1-2 TaxID=2107713 RepID=UPI000E544182|nr:Rv3654c family TadE-like protein [Aeromicrobium sp. A1-2]AXT86198.1 TadE-like protein [Aeromicrobium sp. A1-2]
MKRRSERGAATAQVATLAVVLVLVAVVVTEMAGLVRLRHRVAAAADLAALSATQASVNGRDPCAEARRIAERNEAAVRRCRMDYDVATITTWATSRTWWGHRWAFEQEARAAPDYYLAD